MSISSLETLLYKMSCSECRIRKPRVSSTRNSAEKSCTLAALSSVSLQVMRSMPCTSGSHKTFAMLFKKQNTFSG
jgi:hypothetical protein